MWHGGQLYREGWLIAPGQWYKLRQRRERGYELLPEEVSSHACAHGWEGWGAAACVCAVIPLITCTPRRLQVLFVVNHMVFLKDLSFASSQSGPQGCNLRKLPATGPAAAGRAKGSGLLFLSEDTHNTILDAQGLNASG